MRFIPTTLQDAFLIEEEPRTDERGYFARSFCETEMADAGLKTRFVQHNNSFNHLKGTLRGMHYQHAPHAEVKVVTCIRGSIHDVIIDLRKDSSTYMKWEGFTLAAGDHRQLYIPEGFAHGYLTLEDGAAVSYLVSTAYAPGTEGGVRWNDPAFGIDWPVEVTVISEKDAAWPDYAAG
ncbi:dTDP-4-dehydrorhamnose 3,5-epimerase [Cereibacter changlensis JA139]|uniref:dTDP-4-dehydrorhamnose 3,5-epimerase n=2 Tax=Cereibacter changlensis TaxID=402884 RepID=A0A2T4JUT1_9RHOB|nr:dTDP-4-dehydrorhamnose 3,5-epimerase [Cereibacter changlensis]PTE21671.1 dTDP-4-dehydrorhamnose 3,5-epimerase [Cereibacter changlensis JA139]PZX53638.1 dTDP-4-dehydrorhamnose 3,5-epimerase [Cereibacter changlensis]